jgi:UMF1 family MFS transporter
MENPAKKETWSWSFYDFANSAYGTLFLNLLFPIFYREIIAGGTGKADFFWGLSVAISVILAAFISPFIGAIADRAKNKKEMLITFSLLCIIGTAVLYFAPTLGLFWTSLLFIFTNFFYTAGIVVYDSFLQDVATRHARGTVSGLGWGLGYLGGIIAMVLFYSWYGKGFAGENLPHYLLTYPLIAAFFLIFALPAFIWLKSHKHLCKIPLSPFASLAYAFKTLSETVKHWRAHRNILLFLLAFYLLSDGLNTIFFFTAIYATTTLGLSVAKVAIIFVIVQLVGFPATIIAGKLTDKIGSKPILVASIIGWLIVVSLLLLTPGFALLIGIAVLTGLVIGASQAPARALLTKLVPPEKSCEFFGFNGFASKVSASLGPLLFGAISWASGSQRWALASVLVFFIGALVVLKFVREPA